jgi:hypothetical protein
MHPSEASWPPAQQGLARRLCRATWFTFARSHRGLRSRCGRCCGEHSRVSVPGAALGSGRQGRPGARLHCGVCAACRGCSELGQAAGLGPTAVRSGKRQHRAPPGARARPRPTAGTSAAVAGLGTGIGRRGGRGEPQGARAASMAVCSGKRALLPGGQIQRSPFDLASHQPVPLALAALHPNCSPRGRGPPPTPPDLLLSPDSCKACL